MALRAGGRERAEESRWEAAPEERAGGDTRETVRRAGEARGWREVARIPVPRARPGQGRHRPRAYGRGCSRALLLSADATSQISRQRAGGARRPARGGKVRRLPGQRWARTSRRDLPPPARRLEPSSPRTRSFLDPRGSTSAILASLKSDKKTNKVCKGPPPFPAPLSFCQAVAFGHPPAPEPRAHLSTASPVLRRSPDLSPEIQKPRQAEFPPRLWDSEPGRTGEPEGDTEQVESCPFVTSDLAAQG